jgi:hypothetical protein
MFSTVYLAAEDVPGLAVGRKLLAEHPGLSVYREENGRGYGTLKRKAPNYDQMGANGLPVLLLTDLDADPCPSEKRVTWLGRAPSPGFLFRICVREVEAWLLADREAIAAFLKVGLAALPLAPESLPDPKAKLIQLAQKSPRRIRAALTPVGRATIGPDYNELLEAFIAEEWSIDRAAERAQSLARARQRIAELATAIAAQSSAS